MNKAALLAEIMRLPEEERRELLEEAWESLPDEEFAPLTAEQIEEVERRIAEHERDPSRAVPWTEAREWLGSTHQMTRRLIVTLQARSEIAEASDWYNARSPRTGVEFLRAIDDAIEVIVRNPLQYQTLKRRSRRAPVGKFPYGLFYSVSDSEIIIVACVHGRQHPRRWQSRVR